MAPKVRRDSNGSNGGNKTGGLPGVFRALRLASNRVAFAKECGLTELDPWQEKALRSSASRMAFNCSRQVGKTTLGAVIALHTCLYEPGSLVLGVAPSLRQSQELFFKLLGYYRNLGQPIPPTAESRLSLELENGSRFIALPGSESTTRGFSAVRLLLLDEASRISDSMYSGLRPMLAVSGGRLITMSTPWGKRGWWYLSWESDEAWERYEIPATSCPRIPASFLAEERQALGDAIYSQEYECQFLSSSLAFFTMSEVEEAFDPTIQPLFSPPASFPSLLPGIQNGDALEGEVIEDIEAAYSTDQAIRSGGRATWFR